MHALTPELLHTFLDGRERLAARIDRQRLVGNHTALDIVERHLRPCREPLATRAPHRSSSGKKAA